MSDEIRNLAKTETIELTIPLQNVGQHPGGRFDPRTNKTYFSGRTTVTPEVAEGLRQREAEYKRYETSLIRDNGKKDIEVSKIVGGSGN
jgi:hypothetical protein